MICLKPLAPHSPDAALADGLNRRAFPENEYVPMSHMLAGTKDGDMDVLGVYEEERFSGFMVMRRRERLAYVCFFAIMEEARCRGVGGQSLRLLQAYYPGKQIVVDFEAVDDRASNAAQRRRRRAFYLRNGFRPTAGTPIIPRRSLRSSAPGRPLTAGPSAICLSISTVSSRILIPGCIGRTYKKAPLHHAVWRGDFLQVKYRALNPQNPPQIPAEDALLAFLGDIQIRQMLDGGADFLFAIVGEVQAEDGGAVAGLP